MTSSPARSALAGTRLPLPTGSAGGGDYASLSLSPRRKASRSMVAEEGVRHFEDVPLPPWSVSPRRTVSPASRSRKAGLQLSSAAILLDASSATLSASGVSPSLSFSSPLSPSSGALVQLPPSAFDDPHVWEREHVQLRGRFLRPSDAIGIYHDYTSPLNSRATMRHVCVVRPLPDLEKVQEALRRRAAAQKAASAYDVFEQHCSAAAAAVPAVNEDTVSMAFADGAAEMRGAHCEQRNDTFIPAAKTWCVGGSSYDNEIAVYSTVTGQRLMRVLDPKMKVAVTALQHAPFRGFMEKQQLHVLPVHTAQDVLRLNGSQLVCTDYVWCGLQDGTVRLLPASHHHVRAGGPSPPFSKSPSAHLVFELPRYQGGAIVSIVGSPCSEEAARDSLQTSEAGLEGPCGGHERNRLSAALRCMTAAAAAATADSARQHLSLVCTASTDATVIVWDVRKVYEAVAQAQQQHHHHSSSDGGKVSSAAAAGRGSVGSLHRHGGSVGATASGFSGSAASAAAMLCNDVVTFDCSSPVPGLQNMVVRSSCTLLQVRPVAKLKGGFAGLTTLRWVSSLITAGRGDGQQAAGRRDVAAHTRVPQMAPHRLTSGPERDLVQSLTRFDKREAQRAELELTEEEMQGMERELEHMLPPLAPEPLQSLRVNLLIAADCMGTVHVWNLDEELHRFGDGCRSPAAAAALGWPADFCSPTRSSVRSASSCSESRSSVMFAGEPLSPGVASVGSSTKRKAAGGSSARGSGLLGGKKTERSTKGRRPYGGLGLAEARESRSRLSELPANTAGAAQGNGASPARKSQQRPSMGRTSCEDRDGVPLLSAPHRSPQHGSSPSRTAGQETHLAHARRDLAAVLSPAKSAAAAGDTPAKKLKKTRRSVQEGGPALRSSLQAPPSRASAQRSSASPGRHPVESSHLYAPTPSLRPRASLQRGASVSLGNSSSSGVAAAHDLGMAAQTAKCQFDLADGAAITDLVVDLPLSITVTLRRVRSPSRVVASWQHRPTEAEMDARVLENEFEELTEEKALFFAFQRLELYVGVDGAVSSVRCVPAWQLPDYDGRELFKQHGAVDEASEAAAAAGAVAEWMAEVVMPQRVQMDAFALHLRRRLLDTHAQPVTQLFLDSWQGRLWVARQDGFVSILSTQDKQPVSRIAHPSSDALLPPAAAQEWAKLQGQWMARCAENGGMTEFGLECHKECKGLPPNYFTEVVPVAVRRQRSMLLLASCAGENGTEQLSSVSLARRRLSLPEGGPAERRGEPADRVGSYFAKEESSSSPPSSSSIHASIVCMDGQSDVRGDSKVRLAHHWRWLQELQLCRTSAITACQAQRRRYHALCDGVGRNVAHVMAELGDYAALSQLRACFTAWKEHCLLFGHSYVMRRQRTARLQREQPLAQQLQAAQHSRLRGAYFGRWMALVAERRRSVHDAALERFALAACPSSVTGRRGRRLPTPAMMARLHLLVRGRSCFAEWRAWAAEAAEHRRQRQQVEEACRPFTPLLSLRRSVSSPVATPLRRHHGEPQEDTVTPYRPSHTSGSDPYAYTASSWTPTGQSVLGGPAPSPLSLPASVEPFMTAMAELLRARVYVCHFSDARSSTTSVLDESWTVILENAESGAEGEGDDARRFSVFRFALLPLLQGLISTADDVLPNLFDRSVAEEVLSMLVGIVLSMDYVTANAECVALPSWSGAAAAGDDAAESLMSAYDASLMILRIYAVRAFRADPEAAEVLRGLAKSKKVLAQFLDFAMERAVMRRMERV